METGIQYYHGVVNYYDDDKGICLSITLLDGSKVEPEYYAASLQQGELVVYRPDLDFAQPFFADRDFHPAELDWTI